MNWLRKLLPGTMPDKLAGADEYETVRERTFHTMMLAIAGLALILCGVLISRAMATKSYLDVALYILLLSLLIVITVFRNIPYSLRSGSLLLVAYGASVISLLQSGLSGHGQVLILTWTALAGILLGIQMGFLSLLVATATLSVFAFGMTGGLIPTPPTGFNGNSGILSDWMSTVAFFLLLSSAIVIPLGILIRSFQSSMKRQKELSTHLEKERAELESSVQARTADLERRITQIRAAAEVSRSISSELNPQTLLDQVVNLLVERLGLYYAGLFLIESSGRYAILRAGTGDAGQKMIADGHRLLVGGNSMIGWTTVNRQARIALDVGEDSVRFNNPYLPLTRSELALPILGPNSVLGALTIQSDQANAFDDNDILVYQGVADSLATALENARMFQQNQRDLDEIRSLNRQYLETAWEETNRLQGGLAHTYEDPLALHQETENCINVPVLLRNQVIGEISFDIAETELSAEDRAVVEAITTQTALALENARLLEETQRRAAQEEQISAMSTKFSSAISIEEIMKTAIQELSQLPAVTEVAVHLMPETKGIGQSKELGKNGSNGKNGKERVA